MGYDYEKFLDVKRLQTSTLTRSNRIDEFYSDRSRIIFCSSFRRLQQKAQVFSLVLNSSIRTRMTHSLEVSDLGRTLANGIAQRLSNNRIITEPMISEIVAVVENSCLIHDIGNPPFGHFGEKAIREWSRKLRDLVPNDDMCMHPMFDDLMRDFYEFDGNPQGFRIITKLHTERDQNSLNLTYATLLCALKYTRTTGEYPQNCTGKSKKPGYFRSEEEIVKKMKGEVGIEEGKRYPFTYIMEAVDDIAYCLSDISDGMEKNIINMKSFLDKFRELWEREHVGEKWPSIIPEMWNEDLRFNTNVSVPCSRAAVQSAIDNYIRNHDDFYNGTADRLIPDNGIGKVLNIIHEIATEIIYPSYEAESIELAGYSAIIGLLKHFEKLLKLQHDQFKALLDGKNESGFDTEKRLLNRIGERYKKAYMYALKSLVDSETYEVKEWWLRIHLIIDHVSGMTDDYAFDTYQTLEGIKLIRA